MNEPTLKFIGSVQSPLKNLEDCPLQEHEEAPQASIIIFPEFMDGIRQIKKGSEIILLTWFHEADRSVIKCIPRRNYDAPQIGVFSTRSPDRPNPIGLHTVKIVAISENGEIKVSALEALDGTPVIDIKPVLR